METTKQPNPQLTPAERQKCNTIARMVGNMLPYYFEEHSSGPPEEACVEKAFEIYAMVEQRILKEQQ